MTKILGLSSAKSIKEKIGDTTHVYYKSGVWNKYELCTTERALSGVDSSSYGGDLWKDDKDNYYICCPSYCDMF